MAQGYFYRKIKNVGTPAIVIGLLGLVFLRVQPSWRANAGWLMVNYGLAKQEGSRLESGQRILESTLHGERYTLYGYLVEAKLDPTNVLVNGGFEFNAQGWVITGGENIIPKWVKGVAYSGDKSLMIAFDGRDVNFYQAYQEVAVANGGCYRLTAYIRTQGAVGPVGLEVWDAERGYGYWYGGQAEKAGGAAEWTPVGSHFCVRSDVHTVQVRLRRYGGEGVAAEGTAWFDDVRLEPVPAR